MQIFPNKYRLVCARMTTLGPPRLTTVVRVAVDAEAEEGARLHV